VDELSIAIAFCKTTLTTTHADSSISRRALVDRLVQLRLSQLQLTKVHFHARLLMRDWIGRGD
jgi:hypothetical protein